MTSFEGQIRQFVKECATISHYHYGVSYSEAFELTPFEKDVLSEFIEEEFERENKRNSAMLGRK